jgi:FKBP-type peptidyl-prolyl cis-trans isomerase
VVKGWTQALQLMVPGDKWELTIPVWAFTNKKDRK